MAIFNPLISIFCLCSYLLFDATAPLRDSGRCSSFHTFCRLSCCNSAADSALIPRCWKSFRDELKSKLWGKWRLFWGLKIGKCRYFEGWNNLVNIFNYKRCIANLKFVKKSVFEVRYSKIIVNMDGWSFNILNRNVNLNGNSLKTLSQNVTFHLVTLI